MSNPRKASAKSTVRKSKASRKPRAVALAIEQPRVIGARQSHKTTATSRRARKSLAPAMSGSVPIFQLMWQWSPWNIMLNQQAVLASVMSKMMSPKE